MRNPELAKKLLGLTAPQLQGYEWRHAPWLECRSAIAKNMVEYIWRLRTFILNNAGLLAGDA
jgi:hypothetical protein